MKIDIQKIKVAAVLGFAGFTILLFTFSHGFVSKTTASISGPPAARTGAPGELTCTDCHNASTEASDDSSSCPGHAYSGPDIPDPG